MIQDFSNKSTANVVRPKTLVCYICGREFGTQSLNIHLKSCQKKWETEQAKLPKNQRRPLPKPPSGYDEMAIKVQKGELKCEDMEKMNQEAFKQYDQVSLIKCDFCNRTFLPERMDGHRKLCSAEKPFKPLLGDRSKKAVYIFILSYYLSKESPDNQVTKSQMTPQKQKNQLSPSKPQQARSKSPGQSQQMSNSAAPQQYEEEKISPKKSNFGQQKKEETTSFEESGNYKEKYESLKKDYEILKIEFEAVKKENELLKKKMKSS